MIRAWRDCGRITDFCTYSVADNENHHETREYIRQNPDSDQTRDTYKSNQANATTTFDHILALLSKFSHHLIYLTVFGNV